MSGAADSIMALSGESLIAVVDVRHLVSHQYGSYGFGGPRRWVYFLFLSSHVFFSMSGKIQLMSNGRFYVLVLSTEECFTCEGTMVKRSIFITICWRKYSLRELSEQNARRAIQCYRDHHSEVG